LRFLPRTAAAPRAPPTTESAKTDGPTHDGRFDIVELDPEVGCERRVAARIEAATQGFDTRYVVTNLEGGSAIRHALLRAGSGREI
jgi:hypothetical protein